MSVQRLNCKYCMSMLDVNAACPCWMSTLNVRAA
jgi:hypothetical protein